MDVFFGICLVLGLAIAAWLAFIGLAALLFNRPVGIVAGAAARLEGEDPSVRPLGLLMLIVAVVVAVASLVLPPLALLFFAGGARLFFKRRRQAESSYAGLRSLK